jgi:3-deoxy-D-manno-octulosonic-acid transferase
MRYLYSLIMYLLTPFLLLRLWWKGRQLPAYRQKINERFCLDKQVSTPVDVWVHAVSLGEVIAATGLINKLLDKKLQVLITTTTPTGYLRIKNYFGDRVIYRYVPCELPIVLRRFFTSYQPIVGVIIETELWPNLIMAARKAGTHLLLANARLSKRSYDGYRKIRYFFKPLLNQFRQILAQSQDDAQRFELLGADSHRINVFGNIKFDLQLTAIDNELVLRLKKKWGTSRVALIAASTHDDEEQQLLSCLSLLQKNIPDILLLIAPRHPERFQTVYQLSCQKFRTGLQSKLETIDSTIDVLVLDCLGELLSFYHISDYAFVGGSLVPKGGHNMLEPIALGIPVITGPHLYHFQAISDDLVRAQGIEVVNNTIELVEKISLLQKNNLAKEQLIANARKVFVANQGVLVRYLSAIEALLI